MSINTNADRRTSVCLKEEDDAPVLSPPRRQRPDGMPTHLCGLPEYREPARLTHTLHEYIRHAEKFGPEMVLESAWDDLDPNQLGILVQALRDMPPLQLKDASGKPAGQIKFRLDREQSAVLRGRMESAGLSERTIRKHLGRKTAGRRHAKPSENPFVEPRSVQKTGGSVPKPTSAVPRTLSVSLGGGLRMSCSGCRREFVARRSTARFCSNACKLRAQRQRKAAA